MKRSAVRNIIPLLGIGTQPAIKKELEPIASNWKAIRRQLYKLFSDGRLTDPFNRDVAAIILGPGSIGPAAPLSARDGILYITGEVPKYFRRASRRFQAFHLAYYGYELSIPDTFDPVDLRTYRLVFFWERAHAAYVSPQKQNLRQNRKT